MMNRRQLNVAIPSLMLLGLARCSSSSTSTVSAAQITTDVQTLAAGLSGIAAELQAVPGVNISAGTIAQINTEIAALNADAAQIATAASQSTVVGSVQSAVTALVGLVSPFFPAAAGIAAVVDAAVALVNFLVGAVSGTATGAVAPVVYNRPLPSVDAARATLKQHAAMKH
jgi:hypothetical protein